MPAPAVALLTVVLAAIAALARPRLAFATIVATTILLPDTLSLPTGVSGILTVHLVVTVGALGGLLWRTIAGRTTSTVWRPTGAALGLSAYLVVAILVGVAFAAAGVSATSGAQRAVDLIQELAVLAACTALIREDGRPSAFVLPVVLVLAVSVAIGVIEHATGDSWGHFLFSDLPSQASTPAATALQTRGGAVRVRAGGDFALSYAWVLVGLLPLVLYAAVRIRRPIARVGLAVLGVAVLLAIYWSGTRSALLGLAVALLIIGGLSGRPKVAAVAIGMVLVGLVAVLVLPAVGQHFSFGVDSGSIDVRQQRIPIVLGVVSGRPMTGVGLSGLSLVGLSAVDSTFLLVYGETGVLGLAALVGALLVAVVAVSRGLRARDLDTKLLVACCLGGMLAIFASGFALDSADLPSVIDVAWELAAIALVAGEVALGPARLLRPVRTIVAGVAVAAAVGGVVAALSPTRHAANYTFFTLPPATDVVPGNLVTQGDTMITTACGAIEAELTQLRDGVKASCRNPFLASGEGDLRLEAASPNAITQAIPAITAAVHRAGDPAFALFTDTPSQAGRPTGLVTLPVSLAMFAAVLGLGLPLMGNERSMRGFRVLPTGQFVSLPAVP